jgi:hypothetical protein
MSSSPQREHLETEPMADTPDIRIAGMFFKLFTILDQVSSTKNQKSKLTLKEMKGASTGYK